MVKSTLLKGRGLGFVLFGFSSNPTYAFVVVGRKWSREVVGNWMESEPSGKL